VQNGTQRSPPKAARFSDLIPRAKKHPPIYVFGLCRTGDYKVTGSAAQHDVCGKEKSVAVNKKNRVA
jgi:hypothetical protein